MIAAPFLFWALGAGALDDPGEGMHAEIARELLGAGRLLPLTLGGVPYVDKPPLLYALLAGAFEVLEWLAAWASNQGPEYLGTQGDEFDAVVRYARWLAFLGDWAYMRAHLDMTVTPPGGAPVRRSGYTLTILRKEPDGKWRLARDANLLTEKG